MALLADGTVVQWGKAMRAYPVPAQVYNIIAISAGVDHALALRSDGKVLAWGANQYGQINVPADLTNAVSIAAGLQYSLVLTSDAKVIGWGTNTYGVRKIPALLQNIVRISAGYANSAIVLNSGNVVTLGAKEFGSLTTRTPTIKPAVFRRRFIPTTTPSYTHSR